MTNVEHIPSNSEDADVNELEDLKPTPELVEAVESAVDVKKVEAEEHNKSTFEKQVEQRREANLRASREKIAQHIFDSPTSHLIKAEKRDKFIQIYNKKGIDAAFEVLSPKPGSEQSPKTMTDISPPDVYPQEPVVSPTSEPTIQAEPQVQTQEEQVVNQPAKATKKSFWKRTSRKNKT